jgi:hypothetical protein
MDSELQSIVDSLSQRFRRPAAIDDPRLHLLVHSAHESTLTDRVRIASILTLDTPPDAQAWVRDQGIAKATGPLRLKANGELGMDARVCVPVRANGVLLGFLWLTEGEPRFNDEELAVADQAAAAAAAILYRHQFGDPAHRVREIELTQQLLAVDLATRARAAHDLANEGIFAHTGQVGVIVAKMRLATSAQDEPLNTIIGQALDHFRRSLAPHMCLTAPRGAYGVAIVADDEPALAISGLDGLAAKLLRQLEATARTAQTDAWVAGCSSGAVHLADVDRGYREAADAAAVAQAIDAYAPVAVRGAVGPYGFLAELVRGDGTKVPEPIARLLALPSDGGLAETLERYLDLAGDAKESADQLSLHRGSLYHRLKRIEKVTGRSLKRGDDRLELHLGIKLARMLGEYPRRPETSRR